MISFSVSVAAVNRSLPGFSRKTNNFSVLLGY